MTPNKGYVFINEDGEFAREGEASGFGTGKQLYWAKSIHSSTVFMAAEPWHGLHNKHLKALERCQRLEAVSEVIVKFTKWTPPVLPKTAPCPPPLPGEE